VKYIRQSIERIERCVSDHGKKIRILEVEGSEKSKAAVRAAELLATSHEKLLARVTNLELGCISTDKVESEKKHWTDSIWTKAGITVAIVGGITGIVAFFIELGRGLA
jgi:hypothetical protein